jgi:hypothetical protein
MIKILLVLLIVVGGLALASKYLPQFLGAALCNIAGFTVTGGFVLLACLVLLGMKFVGGKH